MADGFSLQVVGLEDALRELRALPAVLQQRVMRGATANGASVIRLEAIRRAPSDTGTLKKAIYQVRVPQQCTPVREVFRVDVRQGKRAQTTKRGKGTVDLDAYYASWVEYGHFARVPHATTKTAKAAARALGAVRFIPARPFMRPALETKAGEALQAMTKYISEQLPLALAATKYLHLAK